MASNSESDVRRLWQEQRHEEEKMTLSDIRERAAAFHAKTRRSSRLGALLVGLLIVGNALEVWIEDAPLERIGSLLTIAAFVYVAFRFRKYHMAAPPAALGRTGSVEFYRAELVRQRDLSSDGWGFLLPFVPGVGLSLFGDGFGDRSPGQVMAIAACGVALFLGAAWINARSASKLQKQIEALDAT